jgi:phosphoenolpyruvate-protein kinase (PTS system EI component)
MRPDTFTGTPASTGIGLGLAHRTDRGEEPAPSTRGAGDAAPLITDAFAAVAEHLRALAAGLRSRGQREQADIMEATSFLADDRDLRDTALRHAAQGNPVTVAVRRAIDTYASMLAGLDDPTLAERATDVRQVGRRVLARLNGGGRNDHDGPLVLLAHEIGAADLLEPHAPVVAAASVTGGPNSHAAIVARSLGIPLLLGVDPAVLDCPDGTEVLVDAGQATVTVRPEPGRRVAALAAMEAARARRAALVAERGLPCQSVDGHPVGLRANIATPADADAARQAGGDGIGLLRTELPFLDATAWPSYAQHTAALVPIFRKLAGTPVTVRTLDYADDKLPPFLAAERDGRLGRGLPLMLAQPDAFADQFRAILAAGAGTDLRILIPMVADVPELRACRDLLDKAAAHTGVTPPRLGAMIELPEAVANADEIAALAEFLSIGSNDLTCQLLGLDRRDPAATPAMAAHPRVLRAIAEVVTAAHRRGRPVSVCGDAAADPRVIPLLVGLGCDILSVAPAALDEVRARIRRLDHATCTATAAQALTQTTAEQVWDLVDRHGVATGSIDTARPTAVPAEDSTG